MTPIVVNFSPALTDSHWMTSKGWRAVFRGVAERIDLLNLWILLAGVARLGGQRAVHLQLNATAMLCLGLSPDS